MKKLLLFIFIFITLLSEFKVYTFADEVNNEEQEEVIEGEKENTFNEEQIKNAILEILGEEDKQGFIEKNLDILIASFGGTIVALGVLLYFILKATGKTKDLIDKFTNQGKLTSDQSTKINELIEVCEKLIEIGKQEMKQSLENAGATKEEIEKFENEIRNVMNTLENKEDQIAEILKIALINDSSLIKKGVSEVIKEKYDIYDKKAEN